MLQFQPGPGCGEHAPVRQLAQLTPGLLTTGTLIEPNRDQRVGVPREQLRILDLPTLMDDPADRRSPERMRRHIRPARFHRGLLQLRAQRPVAHHPRLDRPQQHRPRPRRIREPVDVFTQHRHQLGWDRQRVHAAHRLQLGQPQLARIIRASPDAVADMHDHAVEIEIVHTQRAQLTDTQPEREQHVHTHGRIGRHERFDPRRISRTDLHHQRLVRQHAPWDRRHARRPVQQRWPPVRRLHRAPHDRAQHDVRLPFGRRVQTAGVQPPVHVRHTDLLQGTHPEHLFDPVQQQAFASQCGGRQRFTRALGFEPAPLVHPLVRPIHEQHATRMLTRVPFPGVRPVRRATLVRAHQQLLPLQPLTRQRSRGKLTVHLMPFLFRIGVLRHPPDRPSVLVFFLQHATEGPACRMCVTCHALT